MGLASLKGAPKTERPPFADISLSPLGLEGKLTFRAPRVADFFPSVEKRNSAMFACPDLATADGALMSQFLLICSCYVPDQGEQEDPIRVFGGLCQNNLEAFMVLVGLFGQTFPMSLGQAKEEAGNASGQQSETS